MQKKTAQAQTIQLPEGGNDETQPSLVHVLGNPRLRRLVAQPSQRQSQSSTVQSAARLVEQPRGARNSDVNREQISILLIDDDHSFGAILKRSASKAGLNMTVCHDLDALAAQMNGAFAVAIVDYDLGSVTGFEIVKYLENQAWNTPFVFISQSDLPRHERQVNKERRFIHKARGPGAIIEAVFEAHNSNLACKEPKALLRPSW